MNNSLVVSPYNLNIVSGFCNEALETLIAITAKDYDNTCVYRTPVVSNIDIPVSPITPLVSYGAFNGISDSMQHIVKINSMLTNNIAYGVHTEYQFVPYVVMILLALLTTLLLLS